MSRQSKNARNRAIAKQFSEARKAGRPGPSKTEPKHGKKWTYRSNPELQKRLAEAVKAMDERRNGKSGLQKVLEGAGSAAD